MKKKWIILVSLWCGSSAFGCGGTSPKDSSAEKACDHCKKAGPTADAPTTDGEASKQKVYTEAQKCQFGQVVGCLLAKQSGLSDLRLSSEERDSVVKGFEQAFQGRQKSICDNLNPEELRDAMQYYQQLSEEWAKIREAEEKKTAEENKRKAEVFFKELDQNPKIQKTASGLRYEILDPGTPEHPGSKHEVTIHYVGKLTDGTVFDSSKERNEPAELPLGQVIPGFSEGLQLVGKGGKIKLWILSELGYGDRGLPKIPAGSTLVFEVEVLDFKEAPSESQFDFEALRTKLEEMEVEEKLADTPSSGKGVAPMADLGTDAATPVDDWGKENDERELYEARTPEAVSDEDDVIPEIPSDDGVNPIYAPRTVSAADEGTPPYEVLPEKATGSSSFKRAHTTSRGR
jgi:FKBP-type peptidyl-prolyl cis-trans isomerase